MRRLTGLLSVLGAAVAFGGNVAESAGGSAQSLTTLSTAAAGIAPASSARRVNATRRALALRVAERMLEGVAMPAGTQQLSREPTDVSVNAPVDVPIEEIYLNASVTRTRFYRTPATPAAVVAVIRAGLSSGANVGPGSVSAAGLSAIFRYPVIDRGRLRLRQLAVQASPTTDGRGTVVRIDAEVQSIAERLPAQAIPAAAHVVEIVRPAASSPPGLTPPGRRRWHAPAVALTVTRPTQVRALARDVNALPFTDTTAAVFSCSAVFPGPTVTFTFRARQGGPALAILRARGMTPTTIDPCLTATLLIAGHRQPGLMQAGVLLRQVSRLLDVKLATRF